MSSLLQLALAFIIVLVVPGFAASLALFPRLNQIDITERLAISIGLSITIVIAIGMLLSYGVAITGYGGGITIYSLSASIALITLLCLIIWALRATSLAIIARRQTARQRQAAKDSRVRNEPEPATTQRSTSRGYDADRYRETIAQQQEDTRSKRKGSRPKRGA